MPERTDVEPMQRMRICRPYLSVVIRGLFVLLLAGLLRIGNLPEPEAAPSTQLAEKGEAIFQQKCISCHSIGGGNLVGPDLKGVTSRQDRDWLKRFILAPDKMIAQKDPIAVQRLKEFKNIPMPNLGLSGGDVEALVAYLETPSEAQHGEIPGQPPAAQAKPLPPGDSLVGKDLFTGALPFQKGGTPCMACHGIAGTGALGGGTLGPDLTHVFQRFGESGLASALQGLPFPSMQGIFQDRPLTETEQAHLLALFAQVDREKVAPTAWSFIWIGLGGFIVLAGLPQVLWGKRLKGVRKRLVGGKK
ncbi:MAG: cytochrome c [Candidatus Tectomicrobia bacterium]|uniref:Cytochrome c n=1 Tax=Tectimicrobiota bacterium TaxID=2528274 RepID=A0A932GRH9_UNCTE|nr:cytochrome c [Candidatus Tectomicrobia bacterium]